MNKKQHEKEILENEILTWTEKKFGHLKPHLPMIGICTGLIVVIFIVFMYYLELNERKQAMPWSAFNMAVSQTRLTGDTRMLTSVADEYPQNVAGLWAMQLAADFELRSGIQQFGQDEVARKEGLDKVRKARELYKKVNESNVDKSTMLQRRSLFGLAYAAETVGDFEAAKSNYQTLVDQGNKSPFLDAASRGLKRTSNPEYKVVYDKFRDWKETPGDAPGPVLPTRPDIGFPTDSTPPNEVGGGSFEPTPTPPTTTEVENEKPPETTKPVESGVEAAPVKPSNENEKKKTASDPEASSAKETDKKGDG